MSYRNRFSVSLALRELRLTRDTSGLALLLVVVVLGARLLLLPWSESQQKAALERYHLDTDFALWALLQLSPAMYNFGNQAIFEVDSATRGEAVRIWVNHHPARVLFEPAYWRQSLPQAGCLDVTLDTRYRSAAKKTGFRTCEESEPRARIQHFQVRRRRP